jgi:hypothetical protein
MRALVNEPIAPTDDCTHHWLLAAPRGDVTAAVCKRCGASRDFLDEHAQLWRPARAAKSR